MRHVKGASRRLLACAALLLPLLVGCDREGEVVKSPAPVKTKEEPVPTLDFLVQVGPQYLAEGDFQALIPAEFQGLLTGEEKRNYLERWVDTELLYQAAESRGLLDDPELQQRLRLQRREFIANHLLQKVLEERVVVTEAEISDYYAEHLDQYGSEYRYREIVVRTRQEASDLYDKIQSKRISFSRAAENNSLASSARVGGDMGWLAKGAMPPEVEEQILQMKPQEVSQPFETAWGWTIIRFRGKRQAEGALNLIEVKDDILRHLTMSKRRRIYSEYLEELQESYRVNYHPGLEARLRADEFTPAKGR